MPRKLIFVHIPKAAGVSLRQAIVKKFDANLIGFEYDKPMEKPKFARKRECFIQSLRKDSDCNSIIFGHFMVGKYSDISWSGFKKRRDYAYITFLREPLQRAVSHYYHWKKRGVASNHRIWQKFTNENWSLERFLLSKEFSNLQSQFLWGFPIKNFDFIGLAEHFEESLMLLGNIIPELHGLNVYSENINTGKNVNEKYSIDLSLAEEFKKRNRDDYELYEQALKIYAKQKLLFSNE